MTEMIELHRAINGIMRHEGWMRRRRKPTLPIGSEFQRGRITVRLREPLAPYVVANSCRVERENWHNRIHHARARWVATSDGRKPLVLEFGQTFCSRALVNPLYADDPVRHCDCGNGDASICPQCEIAFHGMSPSPPSFPCAEAS